MSFIRIPTLFSGICVLLFLSENQNQDSQSQVGVGVLALQLGPILDGVQDVAEIIEVESLKVLECAEKAKKDAAEKGSAFLRELAFATVKKIFDTYDSTKLTEADLEEAVNKIGWQNFIDGFVEYCAGNRSFDPSTCQYLKEDVDFCSKTFQPAVEVLFTPVAIAFATEVTDTDKIWGSRKYFGLKEANIKGVPDSKWNWDRLQEHFGSTRKDYPCGQVAKSSHTCSPNSDKPCFPSSRMTCANQCSRGLISDKINPFRYPTNGFCIPHGSGKEGDGKYYTGEGIRDFHQCCTVVCNNLGSLRGNNCNKCAGYLTC